MNPSGHGASARGAAALLPQMLLHRALQQNTTLTPPVALAKGGTAPACIERNVVEIPDGGIKVYLRNLCGKTMRVKVIVKYWPGSGCKTMKANTGRLFRTVGGRYDRTVVC
ncbi:hypothetical protein [Streptomyces klenkii]|uniref:hypothetical protein n=1 Tax=Streptomyces klenkii TaxID=1420899 RepID=UPI003425FC19